MAMSNTLPPNTQPTNAEINLGSFTLKDYQRYCVRRIVNTPYLGLYLGMSSGKTLITLAGLYESKLTKPALIVAPAAVAKTTWADEVEKHGFPFNIINLSTIASAKGKLRRLTPIERNRLLRHAVKDFDAKRPTLYIVSMNILKDMTETMPRYKAKPMPLHLDTCLQPDNVTIDQVEHGFDVDIAKTIPFKELKNIKVSQEPIMQEFASNRKPAVLGIKVTVSYTKTTKKPKPDKTLSREENKERLHNWLETQGFERTFIYPTRNGRKVLEDLYGSKTYGKPQDTLLYILRHMGLGADGMPIWPFSTVVLDEASCFKSYSSARFKAIKRIRKCTKRLIELTGTPQPGSIEQLWPLVWMLDEGKRLGPTITSFRDRFEHGIGRNPATGLPYTYEPKSGAVKEIYDLISDITISIKDPNLKLDENAVLDDCEITLSPEAQHTYEVLNEEGALTLGITQNGTTLEDEDGNDFEAEIYSPNAATLVGKLLQFASGTVYMKDIAPEAVTRLEQINGTKIDQLPVSSKGNVYLNIHDKKLDMLQQIIADTGSPVLVCYWYQTDLDKIKTRLDQTHANYEIFDGDPAQQKRWNAGKIDILLMHPASGAYGVNLQYGGHDIVWYTLPWSLELYQQANFRLNRMGQTETVIIHRIIAKGTIDEKVAKALAKKDMNQEKLLEAIKPKQRFTGKTDSTHKT